MGYIVTNFLLTLDSFGLRLFTMRFVCEVTMQANTRQSIQGTGMTPVNTPAERGVCDEKK